MIRNARLHTSSQTASVRPLGACDEVCSRFCMIHVLSRYGRKCYPCVCSLCYPCVCPQPTSALSPECARPRRPRAPKLIAAPEEGPPPERQNLRKSCRESYGFINKMAAEIFSGKRR